MQDRLRDQLIPVSRVRSRSIKIIKAIQADKASWEIKCSLANSAMIRNESDEDLSSAADKEMKMKEGRFLIMLNVLVNAFLFSACLFMVESVFPYMAKRLGADVVIIGYLNTMFSFIMMCGGPLYGRFGDVFGSRTALTLSCCSAVLSYGVLGLANSVPMLFLSRVPMGFMHTLPGLQMVITDTSDEAGRADALGKLGLAFALGIMVGPLIGGSLAKHFGNQAVIFVAASVSLVSVVMVFFLLPKNTKSRTKQEKATDQHNKSGFSKTIELLSLPAVMTLMMIRLAASLPVSLMQSMGGIITMEEFKLGPQENGVLMAVFGAASAVAQGFGIGALTETLSEPSVLLLSFSMSGGAFTVMYLFQTTYGYFVSQVLLTVGFSLAATILTSMSTKAVPKHDTGLMLGLAATCDSLMRTITPPVGTFMYLHYGWPSLATFGSAINFGMVGILLIKGQNYGNVITSGVQT